MSPAAALSQGQRPLRDRVTAAMRGHHGRSSRPICAPLMSRVRKLVSPRSVMPPKFFLTLSGKSLSLAECFNSSKDCGNDEDEEQRDEGEVHAGIQAEGRENDRQTREHCGCGPVAGRGRSDLVQLGQAVQGWQAARCRQQVGECRENGDQPPARRAGAREDGARHLGKSDSGASRVC